MVHHVLVTRQTEGSRVRHRRKRGRQLLVAGRSRTAKMHVSVVDRAGGRRVTRHAALCRLVVCLVARLALHVDRFARRGLRVAARAFDGGVLRMVEAQLPGLRSAGYGQLLR